MDFKLTANELDGVPVINLEGEIDIYTAPKFKNEMKAYLEKDIRFIILDLTNVDYVDSTALGVLIGLLKRLHDRGGELFLLSPNLRLLRVFEITGLDKIFNISHSLSDISDFMKGARDE